MSSPIWQGFTFCYARAPFLGPQRKGEPGTFQSPSHPAFRLSPLFPGQVKPTAWRSRTHCLLKSRVIPQLARARQAVKATRETGRHTLSVNNIHQNIYHYNGARASYSSTGKRKGKKNKNHCRKKHCPG